jgi:nitroreductase/Pyruvate/2-oxoacid:ferredoxin oxidoreductase delta subunit
MAVINSYINRAGIPVVDQDKCTACLRCVQDCPTESLIRDNGGVTVTEDTPFGCIGCLHCMAVCSSGAVSVSERAIAGEDIVPLPAVDPESALKQLEALFLTRRSIRRFRSTEVERAKLERILEYAATAPMGIPPSDVQIEVFSTREQVRGLAKDILDSTAKALPQLKLFTTWVGRLIMGRLGHEQFTSFVYPLAGKLAADWEEGRDSLLYDAPAALYIHGTEYAGAMDVGLVLSYVMLAAEAQGLGSCIVGSLHPFLLRNKELREKYGIPASHEHGIVLVLGYPAVHYERAIRRRLGRVTWRQQHSV